jgi:hypothetical protein
VIFNENNASKRGLKSLLLRWRNARNVNHTRNTGCVNKATTHGDLMVDTDDP